MVISHKIKWHLEGICHWTVPPWCRQGLGWCYQSWSHQAVLHAWYWSSIIKSYSVGFPSPQKKTKQVCSVFDRENHVNLDGDLEDSQGTTPTTFQKLNIHSTRTHLMKTFAYTATTYGKESLFPLCKGYAWIFLRESVQICLEPFQSPPKMAYNWFWETMYRITTKHM